MGVLEIKNVSQHFGGLKAIDQVSIDVEKGKIYAIIGPNGAGKTTLFNMITGVYTPTSGKIFLDGKEITGKKPHVITSMGIARTFQNIRLFRRLSVLDNILTGIHCQTKADMFSVAFRYKWTLKERSEAVKQAEELLDFMGLLGVKDERADSLPYGSQRLLEIARALATKPKVLLLDEPAAGMNTAEKADLNKMIKKIQKAFDVTIVLVEHDMGLVMTISDEISVLNFGTHLAHGDPEYIQNHPGVIEAYLGKGDD